MKTKSKHEALIQLDSISKDYSSYNTKMASLTLQNSEYPRSLEASLLIIEYLQIISQILMINPASSIDQDVAHSKVYEGVIFIAKLLTPGYWLVLENQKTLTYIILVCFILLTCLKYALILFVYIIVHKGIQNHALLLYLWRTLCRWQARVLCYVMTSVWVQLILMASEEQLKVFGIGEKIAIAVGSIMIGMEYGLSLFIQLRYCYILPSKSFLCSKDNDLEIITLTQKFIMQILQMALPLNQSGITWVFTTINILFSLLQQRIFFENLPLYNFKALRCQERLLTIVTSLNIACFMQNMLDSMGYDSDIRFIIVTWAILSLLIGKVSREYLNKVHLNFIDVQHGKSSKHLIHRIVTLNYLRSLRAQPSESVETYDLWHLLNSSLSVKIENFLNLGSQSKAENELSIYSKESTNKIFAKYLEDLCQRFPKDEFLKLYIAYFYSLKLHLYGIGMKIITELQKSSSYKISLGTSLLVYDIQKAVQRDYKDNLLNLHSYVKNQAQNEELNKKLFQLISKQRDLYDEVLKESPDLEKIFQWSQKINRYKRNFEARMNHFLGILPDNNVRPLMIYSLYHLSLGHSVTDYLNYQHKYNLKCEKYSKIFKSNDLVEENLYQDTNIFMILSGQKPDTGKILFCTRNIQDTYGGGANLYIGANMLGFAPPCLRNFFQQVHDSVAETGGNITFGIPVRNFLVDKEGYLIETDVYLNVHPHMTRGFFLDVILRPVPTTKDFIMLSKEGNIEGMTRNVAARSGLSNYELRNLSIKNFSQELWEINQAFNLVYMNRDDSPNEQQLMDNETVKYFRSDKKNTNYQSRNYDGSVSLTDQDLKLKEAREIYSLYSVAGKEIEIAPFSNEKSDIDKNKRIYKYKCQVANKVYGSQLLKFVTLEEIIADNKNFESKSKSQDHQVIGEKEQSLEDSGELEIEDEKQGGWINLRSQEADAVLSFTKPFETMEEPLNIPLSPTETTPKALIISSKKRIEAKKSLKQHLKPPKAKDDIIEFGREHDLKLFEANTSIGSQRSKSSQEKRIVNAFKLAVAIKHTPNALKVVSLICYGLLLSIFGTQLSIKASIDKAGSNLNLAKNLMSSAEDRSYSLSNIMFVTRFDYDLATGRINGTGFETADYYANVITNLSQSLSYSNKQLMFYTSSADGGTSILFERNIRVFNSDNQTENDFILLSNFQTVDRIVETSFKVANALAAGIYNGIEEQVSFVLRNTMNDIYIYNGFISDSTVEYVQNERDNINRTIITSIICTALLGTATNMLLIILIIRSYLKEKSHLGAITTLSSKGIRKAIHQINYFRKVIERKVSTENQENIMSTEILKSEHESKFLSKTKSRKENSKTPDYRGLRRKYFFITARVCITGLIIAGLTVGVCFGSAASLQSLQSKQIQLNFASRLKSQAALVGVASQELLAGNGTSLIKNKLSSEIIGDTISSLNEMKKKISSIFMRDDFTYDPLIQSVLFDDGCKYLEQTQWKDFCVANQAAGRKSGLLYLVGELITLAEDKKIKYELSDKSKESLEELQLQDIQTLVGYYFVIAEQCATISKFLNLDFETAIKNSLNQRTVLFVIYTLLLTWIGFMVWTLILLRLMNVISQIKVVLQAFPPKLVLSSFILKTFLIKTSQGALDTIKNNI